MRSARPGTNSIVSLAVLTVLSIGISVWFCPCISLKKHHPSHIRAGAGGRFWLASGKMHDVSITYNSGDELGGSKADSM